MTDPRTLLYLPLFLLSFFIAYQAAAFYLADIFELDDVGVARNFVSEVALSGRDEAIRITQGEVPDKHRSSPNFLIGGPGKVIVDIDSAALFEKPDGTPHVIGPTGREPGGKATLEGFERFRAAIDLRDHYIELRDQGIKDSSVKSRSKDGILITATDVRFMFSVKRGNENKKQNEKKPPKEKPYPFDEKAIENLVYNATSRVTPNLSNTSTFEFSWVTNMERLIRGELSKFMNEHDLNYYLASTGIQELEKAKQEKDNIGNGTKPLVSLGTDDQPKSKEEEKEVFPHDKVRSLFDQFKDEFSDEAHERGVVLHWIGVGTWKTPIEIVTEKHLEAWKLNRENMVKGSKPALDAFANNTIIEEMTTMIQEVPVGAYHTAFEEYDEHIKIMKRMLKSYQKQLIKARDLIDAKAEISPEEKAIAEVIREAINNIIKAWSER